MNKYAISKLDPGPYHQIRLATGATPRRNHNGRHSSGRRGRRRGRMQSARSDRFRPNSRNTKAAALQAVRVPTPLN